MGMACKVYSMVVQVLRGFEGDKWKHGTRNHIAVMMKNKAMT